MIDHAASRELLSDNILACVQLDGTLAGMTHPSKHPKLENLLPGEVAGVRSVMVSLSEGSSHTEPKSTTEDRVLLFLTGSGVAVVSGKEYRVARESIAHFPLGETVEITAVEQLLTFLILALTLTSDDMEDIATHDAASRAIYIKTFAECEPYGERIKSPKTVSRTLLPKGIVPRLAIGTVQTTGPDLVALHRHPMLEQYFLGLEENNMTVIADDARTPLGGARAFSYSARQQPRGGSC